ncbi:SusC/RagA family TonB-linked outer membrane protein [Riemerella anatipestifer]|uniref:SusC/RagA family TonB-linked outer membrane protein n=1 Tax=Riemerella anatipestifer TaxID=34085 RepID=UPI0007EDF523|nr:SusC/RagA family TonB-linked outer membrane protein [Riemerella anatipestifer]MCE4248975.1 SusC/RagA family TonB-linked outer membrane protein [Riemerella anatipestifer]MCU7581185.1 SusC/RagA family TonB-linked outer membrane protein [Riemerella anatipestifer]MDR7834168.1 SusC/RagA family TonB-linked outer membrane protein [Riemerella anatipestifer]MWV20236.1 SusC/RagA family TonB-linked outer membrane protein [Riemerella anatipestifer]OBP47977.1 SusC/RagA family protein [Riemerella anatipe
MFRKKTTAICYLLGLATFPSLALAQSHQDSVKTKVIGEVTLVNIGYGRKEFKKTSGSVAKTNLDNIADRSVASVADVLQGKTAGVMVTGEGGDPTSIPKVTIRGLGGVNGEEPLYVIDGVLFEKAPFINPNDIESMNVVKDATAAVYGARASGGVIFITTKKGKKGQLNINFDVKQGFQQAWRKKKALNAAEFQDIMTKAYQNAGLAVPRAFDPTTNPDGRITRTDWIEEIFRTGSIQDYNVDLSSGGEKTNAFMSFNYRKQEGTLLNTGLDRYNFRLNTDHQLKPWFKLGQNLSYTSLAGNGANTNDGYTGAILAAMYYTPSVTVRDKNGNYSGLPLDFAGDYGDTVNPVAELERINFRRPVHTLLINPYLEIKINPHLKFRSNLSLNQSFINNKDVKVQRPEIGKPDFRNGVGYRTNYLKTLLSEQILTYDRSFGKHNISLTGLYSFQKDSGEGFGASIENFPQETPSFMYLQNGTGTKITESFLEKRALTSAMVRLNYDYHSRYILSLIGRKDGTSLLPKQNRFENYYAISGAWNIAQENFMTGSHFSTLKLRYSHGLTGNLGGLQNNVNAIYPLFTRFENIIFGENPTQNMAYYASILGNPNLKWGKSQQNTLGIDIGISRDRFTMTVDYFHKKSLDQIMAKPLPSTSGYTEIYENVGTFLDTGFEVGVNFRNRTSNRFRYNINANFATLKNEILSMGESTEMQMNANMRRSLYPVRNVVGQSMYSYYGYKTGGIFQSDAEVKAHIDSNGNLLQPNAKPGDLKFLKANSSTGALNPKDDYVNLGNPFPKLTYAFTINLEYDNWDLSAFFQGVHGNKIFNALKFVTMNPVGAGQNYNLDRDILNAWSPNNTATNIPRVVARDPNGNYSNVSDFYVEDGSFLRLRNFSIGYNVQSPALTSAGIKKLRIYASGTNLLTFTKYTGFDPEVGMDFLGIDQGRYPIAKNIILGVNISL